MGITASPPQYNIPEKNPSDQLPVSYDTMSLLNGKSNTWIAIGVIGFCFRLSIIVSIPLLAHYHEETDDCITLDLCYFLLYFILQLIYWNLASYKIIDDPALIIHKLFVECHRKITNIIVPHLKYMPSLIFNSLSVVFLVTYIVNLGIYLEIHFKERSPPHGILF